MNLRALIVLGMFLLLMGGVAAACTDTGDLEDRIEALEQQSGSADQIAELEEQIMRANMVATLNLLDDAGFHELNEEIQETGEAPAGANGTVRTALRAVSVTTWPAELDAAAQEFADDLQAFFDAIAGDDAEAQTDTSTVAHDMYHSFTADAWSFLAERVGLADTGDENGHEEHEGGEGEEMDMSGEEGGEHEEMDMGGEEEMSDEEMEHEEGAE